MAKLYLVTTENMNRSIAATAKFLAVSTMETTGFKKLVHRSSQVVNGNRLKKFVTSDGNIPAAAKSMKEEGKLLPLIWLHGVK